MEREEGAVEESGVESEEEDEKEVEELPHEKFDSIGKSGEEQNFHATHFRNLDAVQGVGASRATVPNPTYTNATMAQPSPWMMYSPEIRYGVMPIQQQQQLTQQGFLMQYMPQFNSPANLQQQPHFLNHAQPVMWQPCIMPPPNMMMLTQLPGMLPMQQGQMAPMYMQGRGSPAQPQVFTQRIQHCKGPGLGSQEESEQESSGEKRLDDLTTTSATDMTDDSSRKPSRLICRCCEEKMERLRYCVDCNREMKCDDCQRGICDKCEDDEKYCVGCDNEEDQGVCIECQEFDNTCSGCSGLVHSNMNKCRLRSCVDCNRSFCMKCIKLSDDGIFRCGCKETARKRVKRH